MDVAADIDDASRQECDYLLEETGVTTFSRRIHDQSRLVAIPLEVLGDSVEQGLRSTRMESYVVDGVDSGVVISVCD